jgi:hypothetical protein
LKTFPKFLAFLLASALYAHADQVIMKDGTVYKGKIQVENGKAILIGNPPFDPTAYLLETKDIEKVIYEEYRLSPPAERRRGLQFESRINGNVFSSDELSLGTAPSLYVGAGFRIHPFVELDGGLDWTPGLHASTGLGVSDNATPPHTRGYQDFHMLRGVFTTRLYPFFQKHWSWEPYLLGGYSWGRLTPSGSGDTLTGSGWLAGAGAMVPLTRHIFLEGRFAYESLSFDSINFLGQDGTLRPAIGESDYTFSLGISWRL